MSVKLVYVLGAAYSGSTILGALLGGHPEIECVGELARWTRHANPGTRRCACGDLVADCLFWTRVAQGWRASAGDGMHASYAALQRRYERIRDIPSILIQSKLAGPGLDTYRRATLSLLETIAAVAAKGTLVDTSKLPARGLALAMTEGVDIRFIHIVRDGLAYLDSCAKREGHGAEAGERSGMSAGLAVRESLHWVLANLASETTIRAAGRPSVRVRYEVLTEDLSGSMRLISEVLDMDLGVVGMRAAMGEELAFNHMVAGNDVRLRGPVAFRSHPTAGDALQPSARWFFRLVAGALARRYGY